MLRRSVLHTLLLSLVCLFALSMLLVGSPASFAQSSPPPQIGTVGGGDEPTLASTINGMQIGFTIENGTTTIWLRVCTDAPNIQIRSEAVGQWQTEIFHRTDFQNGCSPSTTSWWRMVFGAVPGSQVFRIYGTAGDVVLSEAAFMERATIADCVVTGYGTGTCTPSTSGGPVYNPPPISAPRGNLEAPAANASIGDTLTIAGWAVDLGSWNGTAISRVEGFVNDTSLGDLSYGADRPDVGAELGDPRFRASGFNLSVPTANLPSGNVTLKIQYYSVISGAATTIERPITINPTPGNVPPNAPILVTPAVDATINNGAVTLTLQDGGDPDNGPRDYRDYKIKISKTDNSWSAESDWITATSWAVTLPGQGVYQWQAMAGDGSGASDWTAPRTIYFVVALVAPQPTPPIPSPTERQVHYYWQGDPAWGGNTIGACGNNIRNIGCALTSLAMIYRYYGADHNPGTLNACLGAVACPLYWGSPRVSNCSGGKVRFVQSVTSFNYARLDAELQKGPVILELRNGQGWMHFIVVISGSGGNPANYIVNDPGVKAGGRTTLSRTMAIFKGYNPAGLRLYTGTPALTTAAELASAEPTRLESPLPSANEPVTGTMVLYRNTETEMVLELAAQSSGSTVTEMRVWTEQNPSDVWQPLADFVSAPLDSTYYVQFRDSNGQESAVISAGVPVVDEAIDRTDERLYLPLVVR
jgi:hypothetical protein